MSNYKCVNSFTSSHGKHYSFGTKIFSSEYHELIFNDQRNFRMEEEECYSSDSSSNYTPPQTDYSTPSFDSGSSFDSSPSTDFGGGDFGGGGASSDF